MVDGFMDLLFARYVTDSFKDWIRGLGLEASGHATAKVADSLRDEDLRQDLAKIMCPPPYFMENKIKSAHLYMPNFCMPE